MSKRLCPVLLLILAAFAHGEEPASEATMREMLEQFRELESVMSLVEREYADPVSKQSLWEGAYAGMIASLDDASRYIAPREALLHLDANKGTRDGFGFDWTLDDGRIVISRVVAGSPAGKAGIKIGEVILMVDGDRPPTGTINKAMEFFSGIGEECLLTLGSDKEGREIQLQREPFEDTGIAIAEWYDRTAGIAVIKVDRFIEGAGTSPQSDHNTAIPETLTGKLFRDALERFERAGLAGLILDLRGNPGGSVHAAVEIADTFLSGKPEKDVIIAEQVSRHPSRQRLWFAHSPRTTPYRPLVVLVDRRTASSAEILAAALQDHRRGVVMGAATQGKTTVQQTFRMENGGVLNLTVARFRTPAGIDITGVGLKPDILFESTEKDPVERAADMIRMLLVYESGRP